jgi:hypothetical protein
LTEKRFTRDDLIPFLESQGVAAQLRKWLPRNPPEEMLCWILSDWVGIQQLTSGQIKQLIADLTRTKKLEWAAMSGDSLPAPIARPDKPTGIVIATGSVSVNAPTAPYQMRFYVDGVLKKSGEINSATLVELGAIAGNVIQICRVSTEDVYNGEILIASAGTVGWMSKTTVT